MASLSATHDLMPATCWTAGVRVERVLAALINGQPRGT
jgi:hypothetical protein